MDAVEFIKTWARICRTYGDCAKCILSDFCDYSCYEYNNYQIAKQTVANVLEWSKEHPVKTRQSEFLKMYPDTEMLESGCLNICPTLLSKEYRSEEANECNQPNFNCGKCKRDFWLKEIE